MKEQILQKNYTAMDYLTFALYAFGGLGLEILLVMIESHLWGVQSGSFTTTQDIIHWSITCVIWGAIGFIMMKQPVKIRSEIKINNWLMSAVIIVVSIFYTSLIWNGFKPAIELSNLGLLKFIIQYVYYAFESLLILLIIAHGQKAFEKWFRNAAKLPLGGLFLAVTWGAIHILTQGLETGIYAGIQSLLFGSVYLLLKKDIKYSYLAIAFMFML